MPKALDLIESYLLSRCHIVSENNFILNLRSVHVRVRQSSNVWTILFLVYVNDLLNSITTSPRLAADDTSKIYVNISA